MATIGRYCRLQHILFDLHLRHLIKEELQEGNKLRLMFDDRFGLPNGLDCIIEYVRPRSYEINTYLGYFVIYLSKRFIKEAFLIDGMATLYFDPFYEAGELGKAVRQVLKEQEAEATEIKNKKEVSYEEMIELGMTVNPVLTFTPYRTPVPYSPTLTGKILRSDETLL